MRFIFIAFILISCGETMEGLRDLNDPPLINFSDREGMTILQDSMKLDPGIKSTSYRLNLNVNDPNDNLSVIVYHQLIGQGNLLQKRDTIIGTNVNITKENLLFNYYPSHLGYHQFELTARDNFREESSAIIELDAFDNLPPVAAFTFSRDGRYGRRHWIFDASESYDRDTRYGGAITAYAFDNGMGRIDVVEVPVEEVNYKPWIYNVIFPEDNVYSVAVRVKDNDEKWSQWVEKTVVVD